MKRVKFYIPALLILTSAISNSTFAHNSLEASTPAAGQSLSEGPEFIELTFVDATYLESVELATGSAKPITLTFDKSVSASRHFSVEVPDLGIGEYEVKWMVIGDDTHEITGTFVFAVGQEVSGSEAAHSSHLGH